jgi:hypothetical protein
VGVLEQRTVVGATGLSECGGIDPQHEVAPPSSGTRSLAEVSRFELSCDEAPIAITGRTVSDLPGHTKRIVHARFGMMGEQTLLAMGDTTGRLVVWDAWQSAPARKAYGPGELAGRAASGIGLAKLGQRRDLRRRPIPTPPHNGLR